MTNNVLGLLSEVCAHESFTHLRPQTEWMNLIQVNIHVKPMHSFNLIRPTS